MKHIFKIKQNVYCFEPDETKEKLIYEARVLEHCGCKNSIPLYKVHFIGWNKKWDRIVLQDLLLPLNSFNKRLKEKIKEISIKEAKNHLLRHDLVDGVLDIASKVTNEATFDWDTVDEKLVAYMHDFQQSKESETFSINETMADNMNENEQALEKPLSEICDALSEGGKSLYSKENDLIHMTFCPKINLSENQMAILELDHKLSSTTSLFTIKTTADIEKHAHQPCIIDIFQAYLEMVVHCDFRLPGWKDYERFCEMDIETGPETPIFNFSDSNCESGTRRPMKLPPWPDTDLSASYAGTDSSNELRFEVCNALRVMFDVYARTCLLYESEWAVHDVMVAVCESTSHNQTLKPTTSEYSVKLVPDAFRSHRFGFQPSLFYGYPHLLRLMHKLPGLLTRMSLSRSSLAVVLRHCYSLIRYLELHYRDYVVPGSEVAPTKPVPKRRKRQTEVFEERRFLRSDTSKLRRRT